MTNVASIQAKIYKGYGRVARKLGSNHSFYRGAVAQAGLTDQDGNPLEGQDGAVLEPQGSNDLLLDQNGIPLQAQDGSNLEDQATNAGDPLLDQQGQPLLDQNGGVLTAQTNTGPSPTSLAPYGSGLVSFNAEDMGYKKPNKYGKPTWYALFDATSATVGDYIVGPQGTFFIAAMQPLLPILVVECNRVVTISTPQDQTTGNGLQGYAGSSSASETPIMTGWPASLLQGTKGEKTDAKLPGDTRAPWWALYLPYLEGVTINFGDIVSDDLGRRYIISSAELSDLGWRITCAEAHPRALLARDYNIMLPLEWSRQEQLQRARVFIEENFVAKGLACEVSFHKFGSGFRAKIAPVEVGEGDGDLQRRLLAGRFEPVHAAIR